MEKENLTYFNSLSKDACGGMQYEVRLSAYLLTESMRIAGVYQLQGLYAETMAYWQDEERQVRKMIQQ